MERLKSFAQRRLPLIIGLILLVLALAFIAPRVMAWLPWNAIVTQPVAPPLPAAGPGLPDPSGIVPPQAPPAPPAAGPGLPDQAAGAVPPQAPPAPPVAGPRPPHIEPAGPPPPQQLGGWILGWLLGTPRQWLSIVLIVGGLWLLGRWQTHTLAEPAHPETYQPVQEA